ncbi:hypothetical protein DFQ27_002046, partial [Actinomortierella ambigua]
HEIRLYSTAFGALGTHVTSEISKAYLPTNHEYMSVLRTTLKDTFKLKPLFVGRPLLADACDGAVKTFGSPMKRPWS